MCIKYKLKYYLIIIMNKFFIFLLIILLILLIFIYYNESYDIENFNNLENNITFSLYPKLDNNGNYNNLNINVISSNFLYLNDGVYFDYINDLKDINEKYVISHNIKNEIGSSAKDHTQGGKYWPSFTFSQGKNYSTDNSGAMIRHPLEKLYLINNSDTNDNSMEVKDGQYYFNIIGQKKKW